MERANIGALALVAAVYLLAYLVLWLLSLLGPVRATFEGGIERHGMNARATAAGLVAAFVLLAVIALVAVDWFS